MEKGAHRVGARVALFILIAVLAIALPVCGTSARTTSGDREIKGVSPGSGMKDRKSVAGREPESYDREAAGLTVRRIEGFILWSDELSREGGHGFRTGDGTVDRAGLRRRVEFRAVHGDRAISPADLIEAYAGELEAAGAAVLFRDEGLMTASLDIGGHGSWIEVAATDTGYTVTIIEDIPAPDLSAPDLSGTATAAGKLKDVSIAWPALHPGGDISIADMPVARPPMVTYHVSAAAGPGGDGTEGDPLSSIPEAFEHAEALGAMKVRVVLEFGDYDGDITISRPTDIIGSGDIPKIIGSIDGAGRNLVLENLEIREAPGAGVRQDGGTLEMINCRVVRTLRSDDEISSGRGVVLSGGAEAVITGCVFRSNEGQALLLTGEGTMATCCDLQAAYNQVHPAARENAEENNDVNGTGCVEVSGGAKLLMEEFDLIGNEFIGVLVLDGASAHLRYGRIDGTEGFGNQGGFNLTVLYECAVELRHFVTSNAVCGMHMFHSTLRVIDIELIGNSIGISFQEPPEGYDLGACLYAFENNIMMQDNSINFDGTALTVPDSSDILGDGSGDETEPWCPGVTWE